MVAVDYHYDVGPGCLQSQVHSWRLQSRTRSFRDDRSATESLHHVTSFSSIDSFCSIRSRYFVSFTMSTDRELSRVVVGGPTVITFQSAVVDQESTTPWIGTRSLIQSFHRSADRRIGNFGDATRIDALLTYFTVRAISPSSTSTSVDLVFADRDDHVANRRSRSWIVSFGRWSIRTTMTSRGDPDGMSMVGGHRPWDVDPESTSTE